VLKDKYALVSQRLRLVEMLTETNGLFRKPELIEDVGDNGWTHPWRYVDALRNYLLLTCFDVLGQTREWIAFDGWLKAKKCREERATAVEQLTDTTDPVAVASALHEKYMELYGVKLSFYNFIHTVISSDARTMLYQSIRVPTTIGSTQTINLNQGYDTARDELLFRIRNRYTHQAQSFGNSAGGVFDPSEKHYDSDGREVKGWDLVESDFSEENQTNLFVRDWPNVLISVVRTGLETFKQ
jgi:hypothetical protein